MDKIVLLICMCAFLFLQSCRDNREKLEQKKIVELLSDLNVDNNYDWVIILPGMGCHGCIIGGEYFMQQHASDERILFVLTNISSLKILQQKTQLKFSEYSNILVDKANRYHLKIDNSIYPCIIEVKDGKLKSYKFQSPQSDAFGELEQLLK